MNCQFCLYELHLIDRLPAVSIEGTWFCIECAKYIIDKRVFGFIDKVQNPVEIDSEKLKLIPRFCKTHYQFHSVCLNHLEIVCSQCEDHENCELFQGDFLSFENQVDTFISQLKQTCSSIQIASNIFPNSEEILQASINHYEELLTLLINAKKSKSMKLKSGILTKINFSLIKDLNLSKSNKKLFKFIFQDVNPDKKIIEISEELSKEGKNTWFVFNKKQISSWSSESRTYLIQQNIQEEIIIESLGISMNDKADFTVIEKLEIKCGQYRSLDEFKIIQNADKSIVQTYVLKYPFTLKRNQICSIILEIDSPSLYTFHNPISPQISIMNSKNPEELSPILYFTLT